MACAAVHPAEIAVDVVFPPLLPEPVPAAALTKLADSSNPDEIKTRTKIDNKKLFCVDSAFLSVLLTTLLCFVLLLAVSCTATQTPNEAFHTTL